MLPGSCTCPFPHYLLEGCFHSNPPRLLCDGGGASQRLVRQGAVPVVGSNWGSHGGCFPWLYDPVTHRGLTPYRVDPVPHDAPKPPGYTRFVCVSDTHSRTDPIQMPYGDVLIHAGDFTELGLPSEVKKFNEWLGRSPPTRGLNGVPWPSGPSPLLATSPLGRFSAVPEGSLPWALPAPPPYTPLYAC